MVVGVAMEIAQGLTGDHHCKTVDLIPDFIGALLGVVLVVTGTAAGFRLSRRDANNEPVTRVPSVD